MRAARLSLGAPLFLLHINDWALIFQGVNYVLYVVDTNIFVIDEEEEVLQHKIEFLMQQLEFWFHKNDLILNTVKTLQYHFILTKIDILVDPTSCLMEINLPASQNQSFWKYVLQRIAWHVQIHSLCASLSKAYYVTKSVRDFRSTHMLWSIYFTCFQSQLW